MSSVSKLETGISRLAKRIPELFGICDPSGRWKSKLIEAIVSETGSREGTARSWPWAKP